MLSALPSELVFCIAEAAAPEACFSLASTCRFCWHACASMVNQHRALSNEYRVVTTRPQRTVWKLLNTVLDDPRVAYYIREVNIDRGRDRYYDLNAYPITSTLVGPPAEHVNAYLEARERNPYLCAPLESPSVGYVNQGWERDIQQMEISEGNEGVIIPLLLSLFPRLRLLRYTPTPPAGFERNDRDWQRAPSFWMMHFIRQVSVTPWNSTSPAPFQQLTTLCLSSWDSGAHWVSWTWVYWCCKIPTLKTLSAASVSDLYTEWGEDEAEDVIVRRRKGPASAQLSNVEKLTLTSLRLSSRILEAILGNFRNLSSLRYEIGGPDDFAASCRPKAMMHAIASTCGHSLQELIISDGLEENTDEEKEFDISLREFQKLRVLKCSFVSLGIDWEKADATQAKESNDDSLHLTDGDFDLSFAPCKLFPASLEQIHLEGGDRNFKLDDKLPVLDTLLKAKNSALSKLQAVYISPTDFWEGTSHAEKFFEGEQEKKIDYLMTAGAAYGVEFAPLQYSFASPDAGIGSST